MNIIELFLTAVGLSMDAFAVSLCAGLSMERVTLKDSAVVGLFFGVAQAVMPLIGYFAGARFEAYIAGYDHWIVLVILLFVGGKMVRESFAGSSSQVVSLKFKDMLPLSIATSIDALAVGLSFALLDVEILPASFLIGVVTLCICMAGVKVGGVFGERYKRQAQLAGGVILIIIGAKIAVEHIIGS
jgi:putative Mn2+ efflux pump MntP